MLFRAEITIPLTPEYCSVTIFASSMRWLEQSTLMDADI
ncbi:hypothetical protein CEV32_3585 [Brucella rhizosphaerae]|uniref:Uncharacterized protein n=1 Tax=Brucella rhizosphaerae TaxID=571254 RepID=A0A256FSV4_9HYPH|nr:hypothetical protein CEV32_3585 [Brucella rhizosphaerae]